MARLRISVVGVGNELKADDGIGIQLAKLLKVALPKQMKGHTFQFIATQSPEDHIHSIARFMPDVVLVMDAADFRGRPGQSRLIEEPQVEGFTYSTHNAPLTVFMEAVRRAAPGRPRVLLVGIQAKRTGFGEAMSREVRSCGRDAMAFVARLIANEEKIKDEEDSPYRPLSLE
jgi:hydrogenase 3 maturation protease